MAGGKKSCGGVCDTYNEGLCLGLCLSGDEYIADYVRKKERDAANELPDKIQVLKPREIEIPKVNQRPEEDELNISFTI